MMEFCGGRTGGGSYREKRVGGVWEEGEKKAEAGSSKREESGRNRGNYAKIAIRVGISQVKGNGSHECRVREAGSLDSPCLPPTILVSEIKVILEHKELLSVLTHFKFIVDLITIIQFSSKFITGTITISCWQ